MIAGASWQWWAGFHTVVIALLVVDSRSRGRWLSLMPAVLLAAAAGLAGWIAWTQGRQPALEFAAGYAIEISLSIDNLFVFLFLFQGFEIGAKRQHKALLWGVGGAVVLRALFIAAGVTLLRRFDWIACLLGLFLLYASWRMFRRPSAGGIPGQMIPGWIRRLQPARGSLLPVILAVEFTDLLFATDSIPAVLAVTRNPFLAYTSNIAAVLGLRSLYFALMAALGRFRSLHYGVGALLAFVGLKMLASPWIKIPTGFSLAVIALILIGCVLVDVTAARAAP